ncbi:MAG: MmcQ/YjbR family DNA-binding protein [Betaproteobacteria bacterium]|nr:MmcQ/YjbR family DNA-binding protein [Betaproteobacteria bacterium]
MNIVPLTEFLFKKRKVNIQHLVSFGFTKQQDGKYAYSTEIVDGQFQMIVVITEAGDVNATLIERDSEEEYVLHRVSGASGSFVGKVKEEYEGILNFISTKCFDPDVFKSEYAKKVIQYARDSYEDELEFLWQRFSDNAILRRKDTNKWYAALLVLSKRKLGLDSDEIIEILDLRMNPEDAEIVLDGCKYFPGYHMNKKHWFTICLDGSVPLEEIYQRIDASYALST